MLRHQGFESRAFPTKFILTRPQRRVPGLRTGMAFLAGAVCVLAVAKADVWRLPDWTAWVSAPAPTAQKAAVRKSDTPTRKDAAVRKDADARALKGCSRGDGAPGTCAATVGAATAVQAAPAAAVKADEGAAAIPLPRQKPEEIATAEATAPASADQAPTSAVTQALARAPVASDVRQAEAAAVEPPAVAPPAAASHSRPKAKQRRAEPEVAGSSLVYLYDQVLPNGRRVPVYRRVQNRDDASVDTFAGRRRGRFASFD
jgi:hypothetical protein